MKLTIATQTLSLTCLALWTMPALGRDLDEVKKSGELRVCISPVDDTPTLQGSDKVVEQISIEFAKHLNVKAHITRVGWDDQFFNDDGKVDAEGTYNPKLLKSKKCDFYPSNLTRNSWREKKIDFVTLFPSRMMVVVNKKNAAAIKKPEDLAGKIAAVEKDTSWHNWIAEQNKTTFAAKPAEIKFGASAQSLEMVDKGEADFSLADSDVAMWNTKHKFKSSVVVFPVGETDEIGWGFAKSDKKLKEAALKFVGEQTKSDKSRLNELWTAEYGMPFNKFVYFVSSVKGK